MIYMLYEHSAGLNKLLTVQIGDDNCGKSMYKCTQVMIFGFVVKLPRSNKSITLDHDDLIFLLEVYGNLRFCKQFWWENQDPLCILLCGRGWHRFLWRAYCTLRTMISNKVSCTVGTLSQHVSFDGSDYTGISSVITTWGSRGTSPHVVIATTYWYSNRLISPGSHVISPGSHVTW